MDDSFSHVPNFLKIRQNPQMRALFQRRAKIIKGIRDFFDEQKFEEVETPILVRLPGMEPYLDVFETEFVDLTGKKRERMFLITSPEYAMKKLLVAGYENIFQITKSFRNKETESSLHNPEFTLLEWYRAHADYRKIMEDTVQLVRYLTKLLHGGEVLTYQGARIDVAQEWEVISVAGAFEKYAGISRDIFENSEKLYSEAKKRGYQVRDDMPFDDVFFLIFLNEIEPKLGKTVPTFLIEYPLSMAALSRPCPDNPRYAERVECYIGGMEMANGFSELTDPVEQKRRLELERRERRQLGKTDYPIDQSFIDALECGMPESAGIALGVDRLVMLLTDTSDIRDVILFPHRDL